MCPFVATKPVKVLQEGSFFGEINLLLNIPRAATCRASAYCEVLILERADLIKILQHFPDVEKHLRNILNNRCREAEKYIAQRDTRRASNTIEQASNVRFTSEKLAISYVNYIGGAQGKKGRDRSMSVNLVQRKYIIESTNKFLKVWKMFFVVVLVVFSFLHTYIVAYNTSFGNTGYGSAFGFFYIIDVLYYIDIILHTRTAIKDDSGAPIDSPKLIFISYVCSPAFWLDMLSVVPVELLCLGISDLRRRWVNITLVRTNRLLKLHNVFTFFQKQKFDIATSAISVHVAKLFLIIVGTTHVCACVWFFQACFGEQCVAGSWVGTIGYTNTTSNIEIYVTTVYWAAATMTSTGKADTFLYILR